MEIKSKISNADGTVTEIIYNDADSFDSLACDKVRQAYGVCFAGDKMLIVFNGKRKAWGLIGGGLEAGETFEECLKREVIEESNMKVLNFRPIGFQAVYAPENDVIFQLRYVCTVEEIAPFVADPAGGDITEIKLIDPNTYKQFFDWGEIGERIIHRAIEMKNSL